MNYFVRVSLDYILRIISRPYGIISSISLDFCLPNVVFIYSTISHVCSYVYTPSPTFGIVSQKMVLVFSPPFSWLLVELSVFLMFTGHFSSINCFQSSAHFSCWIVLLLICSFGILLVIYDASIFSQSLACFLTLLQVSFYSSNFNSVVQVGFLIGHINEVAFGVLLINQFLSTKFVHQEFETTGWVKNEFLDSKLRYPLRDVKKKKKKSKSNFDPFTSEV